MRSITARARYLHLAITDGNYLSHTTRTLEVARRLRDAGDEVVFAASGRYEHLVDEAGFERLDLLTPAPQHIMDYTRRSRMDYLTGDLLRDCVAADRAAIQAVAPDCVLGDFRWSLSISTEAAGVPYATIINTLWTHHYACRRTVPEGFALRRLVGERAVAAVGPAIKESLLWIWGRHFNRLRAELDLPPRRNLNYHFYGDLDLLPDLPSLFPTQPLPSHVKMVGPIFWNGGRTSHPERLPPVSGRPLVYASIGSTGTDLFLERLYRGFGAAEVDVVMSTGGQPLREQPPPNFHCIDIVAAGDVLDRAALAVCHGGNGTIYQCLSFGVPILGIATHNDQQWNLDRVAALGVGWRFTQERVEAEELRACLVAVREDPSWRARAAELAAAIAATDGPGAAAREIRDFLAAR